MRYKISFLLFILFFILCDLVNAQNQLSQKETSTKEAKAMSKKLIQGWNTWNTRSVLSQVLLPESFSINLAIKDHSGNILEETLIGRDHYGSKERVIPGPHAYDGSYTELEFEWHNIKLRVQSASVNNELYLLVSPLNVAPGDSLIITPRMLWNRKGEIKIDPQMIVGNTPTNNIKVYVNGNNKIIFSNAIHTSLEKNISVTSGTLKSVQFVENTIKKAKIKFETERVKFEKSSEVYNAMQTVLAWTTIYDPNNNRIINPVSRTFSPDWVLFGWDTYFAAYMLSLNNKQLAYANAIAITKEITTKGFIPNNSQYGHKSEDRSEPQVGSIVVREIYRKYEEKWFLKEVYNELLSWNRWRAANRDVDGYLVHGTDPYDYGNSKLEEMNTPNAFSGYGIVPRRSSTGMRSVIRGSGMRRSMSDAGMTMGMGGAPIGPSLKQRMDMRTGAGSGMDMKVLPPQAPTSVIQTGGPLIQMYSAANSPLISASPLLAAPIKMGGSFRAAGGRSGGMCGGSFLPA